MEHNSVLRFRQHILDGEYEALFAQDMVTDLRVGK